MKKYILFVIIIGFFVGGSVCFHQANANLLESNQKLYQVFKENKLIDVNGEVNLSGIEGEYEALLKEVEDLFKQDVVDINVYIEQLEDIKNSNLSLKKETEELSSEVSSLEGKKKELSNQYSVLNNKYNNLKKTMEASKTTVSTINGFPLINQYPTYLTGCESVALTMLLRYYGVNVMPGDIISKLKKESLPYYENGVRYGGNPEVGFVGNPYMSSSYGVYEKPIAEVANIYKSGIQVRNNFSFNEVLNLVQNNHPVMVWTSMGLSVPYISDSWIYKSTLEKIYWKSGEHAVVVVGYKENTVVVADPIGGKLKSYSRSLFEERYNYFGRKALFYL